MSNGVPPASTATYIIICSGRINVKAAKTIVEKLQAASECAKDFASYLGDKLTPQQTHPISELQHEFMDNLTTWRKRQAEEKINDLFMLLDALEQELDDGGYGHALSKK